MNHRPAFRTPLLINCCTYANPFKTKVQNKKGALVDLSPLQATAKSKQEDFNKYEDITKGAAGAKCPPDVKNSNPPYYYPYWLELIYLPQTKLFEVHASQLSNPSSAIYRVQKIPPYLSQHSQHDFKPHQGFSFLDSVNNLEKQALQDKLIDPPHSSVDSRDLQADEAD